MDKELRHWGSPRRHNPDLYYGQVWLDRKMFDNVRLFADWEKLSLKAAVYQLLVLGLHFYCITQLKLEQARQLRQPAPRTQLYGIDDFGRLLNHIHAARKIATKEQGQGQEDRHPL